MQNILVGAMLSGDAGVVSGLDKLIGMVPKAFSLVGAVMNGVLDIDLFALLLTVTLIGAIIGLFARMRHSVS